MPSRALDPLDFYPTLDASTGVVLVVFVRPACGACRALKAALERVELTSLFVDVEQGPGLVQTYELFHLPAMFVWRDGEFHAPVHAAPTPTAILAAVEAALAGPAHEEP